MESIYSLRKISQDSEQNFKKLLSKIPDLIFHVTFSNDNKLNFSFFNKAVISYFELTQSEIRTFNLTDVLEKKFHPEDFQLLISSLSKLNKTDKNWSIEFRSILPSKGLRWFKAVAHVEHGDDDFQLFGRITDITVDKHKEIELKLSQERFQFAMEAATKGVWDFDIINDRVFYSSQSMKMLEFEEEDIIDTQNKWDERIHPDDIEEYNLAIKNHLENHTPFYENAKRMLTKSGNYKWILSRGKVIERDKKGKPTRLIGTHTDITQQKEEEKILLNNYKIINEQNGRLLNFAHIVAHNLSSHACNFKMLLELAKDETEEATIQEIFTHLNTSSNALSQTIDHLKELVDIQTSVIHKKENLNLNLFLDQTIDILAEEIKKNKVKIIKNIPKNYCLSYNPSYLESILLNFTTNAIKYSHPDRIPEINYSLEKTANSHVLSITDNGLGIDLERHGQKLFGMYKTFHNNANARGIGLFITKNQIEAMGGKIEVESTTNIGTTFKIYFNNEI